MGLLYYIREMMIDEIDFNWSLKTRKCLKPR